MGPPIGEFPAPLGEIEDRAPVAREPSPAAQAAATARIYVGNLAFDTDAQTVRALFEEHGKVTDVHFVTDRETGRPRGFAFVTMGSPAEAEKAIRATDGAMLDGRALRVNAAEERPRGGGGGFRGGGAGRRF